MKILLLGSTGSIGESTCNCIRRCPETFKLVGVSTNTNINRLAKQVKEFTPQAVCVASEHAAAEARKMFPSSVTFYSGKQGLIDLVNETDFDIIVNALVGAAGFPATVEALTRNKRVALANKESLVIGGDIITKLLSQKKGELIPVDSEHSAILQCINGEKKESIESITITASGGPFLTLPKEHFSMITPQQALNHPTWSMGKKITIDSATLMNKGFEVIEAHHLFSIPYEHLHVVIHQQSVVHSMVTYHDGAVMAQCGIPDMELPIQYALTYPDRLPISTTRLNLAQIATLTFTAPDYKRFPCLKLCIEAGKQGGTIMAALNAANEIAVHHFLNGVITFDTIPVIIEKVLTDHSSQQADSVAVVEDVDREIREMVTQKIKARDFTSC